MYYSSVLYVLSVLLYSGSCYGNQARNQAPTSVSITSDGLVQELYGEFMFSCSVTPSTNINQSNITLLIDGTTNGDKMDRISATPANNEIHYTFNITLPSDNGTQFSCVVKNSTDNTTIASSNTLTLQVNYAPIFEEANNMTLYHFIETGLDSHVSCVVKSANPPVTHFTVTNNSNTTTNVHFNSSTGIITFTKAETDNRGGYTCTASNAIGTTFLTYQAFVGGAPDDIDVTVYASSNNSTYSIELGLTDSSDAPAQSFTVGVTDVSQGVIDLVSQGYALPIQNKYTPTILDIPLDSIYTAEYQLFVIATNDLGSNMIYNDSVSMEGNKSLNVILESTMANVTSGNDYTFKCSVPSNGSIQPDYPRFNFGVLINGNSTGDKFDRLFVGESVTNYYQIYTLKSTGYIDDGTVFTCVVNDVYHSDPLSMAVFYPPIFFPGTTTLRYENINGSTPFLCTVLYSHPNVSSLTVSNTSHDTDNIKVTIDMSNTAPSAMFNVSNARVSNRGVYSCNASNEIGSNVISYTMFVGGAPDNLTVTLTKLLVKDTIMVGLNLTDHSDAPAQTISVYLEDVDMKYDIRLLDSEVPATRIHKPAFALQQADLLAGVYSIRMTGTNPLSTNYLLHRESLYLEGTASLDVYFDSSQSHTIEGKPFMFSCSVDPLNVTMKQFEFDVLIDGNANSTKHSRLNSTAVDSYTRNFTFINSTYLDDGTVFTCRANQYYKSDDNKMTVYYAPVIDAIPGKLGNFTNRPFVFNVTITHSNPPKYTLKWLINGKPLNHSNSDAIIDKNSIQFKKLTDKDQGVYTVIADNTILRGSRKSFQLQPYDGPYFKEGSSNTSVLAENKVESNFKLTCTIDHAQPPVTELTMLPNKGPNWRLEKNGLTSVSLVFTKGDPKVNTDQFVCQAWNNNTVATLTFNNYMGDVPKDMEVRVQNKTNSSAIIFSLNVSDHNAAQATNLSYYIEGLEHYKGTHILHPYTTDGHQSVVINTALTMSYSGLGGIGASNYLIVDAYNMIGKAQVMNYSFIVPGHVPNKSPLGVAIGVGVGVPVAVIIVITIVIGGIVWYKKKKSRRGYAAILPDDDDVGGRGSINQPSLYEST